MGVIWGIYASSLPNPALCCRRCADTPGTKSRVGVPAPPSSSPSMCDHCSGSRSEDASGVKNLCTNSLTKRRGWRERKKEEKIMHTDQKNGSKD